jgi:hypothetical protein
LDNVEGWTHKVKYISNNACLGAATYEWERH